jgi:hypothetical protein
VLQVAVVAVAIVSILQWLKAVGVRLTNPYPVEWLEGAFVAHSLRVLNGQPIYIAPSAEFIPNLYPPLAYWVQALAMKWIGPTLPPRAGSGLGDGGVAFPGRDRSSRSCAAPRRWRGSDLPGCMRSAAAGTTSPNDGISFLGLAA